MSEVIFDDLEIDFSNMISDPEGFDKTCKEKGEELKAILKMGNSVTKFLSSLQDVEYDFSEADKQLEEFWFYCDKEVPTTKLSDVASRLRKLASEIEYIATSRAQLALAEQNKGMDKALAHEQYKRLRETHGKWIKAMKLLKRYDGEPLAAMPGNYSSDTELIHYVFLFDGDEDSMLNWNAVCKRLHLEPMNMMDTVEYIESHPETNCTVTRVTK